MSKFESERFGFTPNYNEWLIWLRKPKDYGHVSLNEFESERLEFFIIFSTEWVRVRKAWVHIKSIMSG